MRLWPLLLIALTGLVAGAPAAQARTVTGGVVEIGAGAAGVTLGMSRAAVIERLGRPGYENQRYMGYGPDPGSATVSFDVYLSDVAEPPRVRMLGFWGDRFVLADGTRLFRRGAISRLRARYDERLRRVHDRRTDTRLYRLRTRRRGRLVWNDFMVDRFGSRALVTSAFILYP